MTTEKQVVVESHGAKLYGMVYDPVTPIGVIVFCHPLFEERKSAARTMADTARALCANGFAVVTFDYRGCGDSFGEFRDFSAPDWMGDIGVVIDLARQRFPKGPLGLLGLRLGAAFALQTAAARHDIDFLVLWEPVTSGREHIEQELRKKLMKQMMTFGKGREDRDSLLKTLENGGEVDFDGYPITAKLYRDLGAIDLKNAAGGFTKRSLIVHVTSQHTPSAPTAQLCEALHDDLRLVNEPPLWNLVGLVDSRAIIRETLLWIRQSVLKEA